MSEEGEIIPDVSPDDSPEAMPEEEANVVVTSDRQDKVTTKSVPMAVWIIVYISVFVLSLIFKT